MSVLARTFCAGLSWNLVRSGLIAALLLPATGVLALGTWTVVPTPNPSGGGQNVLNAVAIVAPSDAWAVGEGQYESLAEHWDGSMWSIVPSPNLQTFTGMKGVAAVSSTDVWAVGDNGGVGMTMHWNGSTWTAVANPATNYVALNAVSAGASNDVWAVGSLNGNARSLALHWNGSSWSQIATPSPDGSENFLNGVAALTANNAWAVGQSGLQSFILHWNGAQWSRSKSPDLVAPGGYTEINTLRAIGGTAANDLWAVGNAGASTLALHWNGSSWGAVSTPNGSSPWNQLTGVAAISSTDVWAVGFTYSEIDTCSEGCYEDIPSALIEHWNGASWSVVATPSTGVSSLAGVAASTSGPAWAVGTVGGQTLAEQNATP
jgi:hypothetical protein